MPFILRQAVGDGEPWRLGTNEDVRGRTDGRIIDKGSHGDVNEGAVADHRIKQRAAPIAVRVVVIGVAKDHELVLASAEAQPVARNAGEWLKGRPRRPPAVRTMAVRGVGEFVGHRVMDRAAQALSCQHTAVGLFRICHGLLPSHLARHARGVIGEFMAKFKPGQGLVHIEGGQTVSHDRSSVEAVVQHYFDALYEGDADKLGAVFHPSADLRSVEKGELKVLTMPVWLDWVRKRPSAKAEGKPREDFIVTIDRSDESTAFIKVRCQLPPRYFTDYLVAMKLADGWQIVSKSYRYDLKE